MNCPNCGAVNEEGAAFCFSCGTKFEAQQAQQAQQNFNQNNNVTNNQVMPNQNQYAPVTTRTYPEFASLGNNPNGYPIPISDHTKRCMGFTLLLFTCISTGWTIIPLAWFIPMTVHAWRVYKGKRANRTAFGVCTLIFCGILAGIFFLCSTKEDKF